MKLQSLYKSPHNVVPLLAAFFVFLLLVLSTSVYFTYQRNQHAYTDNVRYALEHYVSQATLTTLAILKVSDLFVAENATGITRALREPAPTWMKDTDARLEKFIYNYRGFLLFDAQGRFIRQSAEFIDPQEVGYLEQQLQQHKTESSAGSRIFGTFFGQQGGLYSSSPVYQADALRGFMILRRPHAGFAQTLRSGNYQGFELWLVERALQKVVIRKGEFISQTEQPLLQEELNGAPVLARAEIKSSPWEIIAVPVSTFLYEQLFAMLWPPLAVLLLYIVLAGGWLYVIRRQARLHTVELAAAEQEGERAEQALDSIKEVVITTNPQGNIIYTNRAAEQWFAQLNIREYADKPLRQVLPLPGATWMELHSAAALQAKEKETRELLLDRGGELLYIELNHHLYIDHGVLAGIVWVMRDITLQVQDREQLQESQARYKGLYEGTGVGMWLVDVSGVRNWLAGTKLGRLSVMQFIENNPQEFEILGRSYRLIDLNDAAMRMHGASNKREAMRASLDFFGGGQHKAMLLATDAIRQGKRSFSLEAEANTLQHDKRNYVVTVTLDTVGPDTALISFIDITERIAAELALKESEQFWSNVIQALPDTVYVNDLLERRTVFASRHVAELLGYNRDEISRLQHWRELVHEEDIHIINDGVRCLNNMQPGEVNEIKVRMRARDGSWRIMRFRDRIFTTNEEGRAKLYVGIGRDVTADEDARIQLAYSERQYRLLAEGISDVIFTLDAQMELTYVSQSVEKILGMSAGQIVREGLSIIFDTESFRKLEALCRKDLHEALQNPYRVRGSHKTRTLDLRAQNFRGENIMLEVQSGILWDENGAVEGVFAVGRDVTQRRAIEQEVRTAAEVFENSSEAIIVTDIQGRIQRVNRAFHSMTGYEFSEVKGRLPNRLVAAGLSREFMRDVRDSLLTEGYWQGEINYRNRNGEVRPSWTGMTALKDENGKTTSHIIISSDITEKKVSEARIQKLAYFDPLTGLPNRSQMHEALDKLISDKQHSAALLFIDLDRFKPINDTMGHPAGDQVLKEVALRLRASIREQDLVARIGGDEFTVIMPGFKDAKDASDEAVEESERILHQLMQPFVIRDRELYLSASIGISLYPSDARNGTDLLRNADTAMYHAKAMGKNNFQFFAQEMNSKAMERLELENSLHQALTRNEFELFYQPQWDTHKGSLCGIETLLRWRRPGHDLVGPDKFIPIIEETGLIVPVGEWVLRKTCENLRDWLAMGIDMPPVAINLSARQFRDTQLLSRIRDIIHDTGVSPRLVELELTESILMDDVKQTLATLSEVKAMGIQVSIDDFGTGYSSLSYLKQFPVDHLKIDRSFIKNLPDNQEDAQITRTIVAMATNLGLGVIAEGVETLEQELFLRQIGCHKVQGFRYSMPVSHEQMTTMLLARQN